MANSGFNKKGKKDFSASDSFERKPSKKHTSDKFSGAGSKKEDKYSRSSERPSKSLRDDEQGDSNERRKSSMSSKPKSTASKTLAEKSRSGKKEASGPMRLNKFIANSGVCSRREADDYIKSGMVKVKGQVVTDMGIKVEPSDEVTFNGKLISPEKKVYVLLNKPKDYVTTLSDPHADKTVIELVKGACSERIYPVGRLDKNTTGLLLFTNDGELTKRLTHPSYEKKKVYHVFLNKSVTKADLQTIADGFELEDGLIKADSISHVDDDKSQVGIEIHSGRNRVVRRIFEHFGYRVVKLDRVSFAGLTKKNLPRGKWRFLEPKEISMLW